MTVEPSSRTNQATWRRLVSSYESYIGARKALFESEPSLIPLLRESLSSPTERGVALEITAALSTEDRKELLGDLMALVSYGHGRTAMVRKLVLSLPHDWLKKTIESYAAPILEVGSDEEYRRLLELYSELDRNLTLRLAWQAAVSDDPEIADVGRDFLTTAAAKRTQTHLMVEAVSLGLGSRVVTAEVVEEVGAALRDSGLDVPVGTFITKGMKRTRPTVAITTTGDAGEPGAVVLQNILSLIQGILRGPAVWQVIRALFSERHGGTDDVQFLITHDAVTITLVVHSERDLVQALRQARNLRAFLKRTRNLPFDPRTLRLAGYADGSWRLEGNERWFEYAGGEELRPYQHKPMSDEGFRVWFHETYGFDPEADAAREHPIDTKSATE
jgi:hypothetical protein